MITSILFMLVTIITKILLVSQNSFWPTGHRRPRRPCRCVFNLILCRSSGSTKFARIGIMRGLDRHVERTRRHSLRSEHRLLLGPKHGRTSHLRSRLPRRPKLSISRLPLHALAGELIKQGFICGGAWVGTGKETVI